MAGLSYTRGSSGVSGSRRRSIIGSAFGMITRTGRERLHFRRSVYLSQRLVAYIVQRIFFLVINFPARSNK